MDSHMTVEAKREQMITALKVSLPACSYTSSSYEQIGAFPNISFDTCGEIWNTTQYNTPVRESGLMRIYITYRVADYGKVKPTNVRNCEAAARASADLILANFRVEDVLENESFIMEVNNDVCTVIALYLKIKLT